MRNNASLQIFAWVALAFGLLLSAWTTLFIVASHNHIAEVPLVTDRK